MKPFGVWIVPLCAFLTSSCAVVDFTQLHVEIDPGERYSVVSPDSGVSLRFSHGVDRDQAEDLVRVVARSRTVAHAMTWEGRTLTITPVEPPEAGTVHELQIQGIVRDTRGRAHTVAVLHHLFYGSDAPTAHLVSSNPADGVLAGNAGQIGLQFSMAMNGPSVEEAVRIVPAVDVRFDWNEAGDTLSIVPRTAWNSAQTYDVLIEPTARSRAGTGLAGSIRRYFRYDVSAVPLEVRGHRFEMAAGEPGQTVPVPEGRDPVILTFSAPVGHMDVQQAVRVRPALSLETRQHSAAEVSLHPRDTYEPDTDYHILIPPGLEDNRGNILREAYSLSFHTPDRRAALESVRLIWPDGDVHITDFDGTGVHAVAPTGPDYLLHAVMAFDRVVEIGTPRQNMLDTLGVERVVPEGGTPIVLDQFVWTSDGRELTTVWSGVTPSGFTDAHALYRLSLPDSRERQAVELTLSHEAR